MDKMIHISEDASCSTSAHHSSPPSSSVRHSSSLLPSTVRSLPMSDLSIATQHISNQPGTDSFDTPNRVPYQSGSSSSITAETTLNRSNSVLPSETSLESILSKLEISSNLPTRMFSSIGIIYQHSTSQEEEEAALGVDNWQVLLTSADESSQQGLMDIEALKLIRTILDRLWSSGSEEDLVNAARLLADRSRETEWRVPFGTSGILDFFLEVIATQDVDNEMTSQTLRLIGNSCADTDSNRESVISQEFLPPIMKQLSDDSLADLAIPVLYNICVDYQPAQEAVKSNSLCPEIIRLLARESFDSHPLLGYICPLLDYSIEESVDVEQCPDHSLRTLLQYASASDIEVEDLVSLVNAIVIHLKHDRFQNLLISQDLVNLPLQIIIQSFSPQASSSSSLSITDLMPLPRDPEEEEQIAAVRSALIRALSDVSAVPKFATQYPIRSPLVKSLLLWLPAPQAEFQICSSIMLGNLARSDIICHSMVHDLRIHEILAATIRESSDLQVLHSALGFLRNLALPIDNKHLLGTAQTIELTSRFWSLDFSPQLQYAAVSLTRQLLSGSIANIQLILTSLSLDPDSPAHEKTYLSLLLALFEKTDQEPARLEISRTIAAIWRCLYASDNSTDSGRLNTTLHRLLSMHGSIGTPIATMVSQSRWPVVRSEGWFALALMARSREGSAAVNVLLQQVEVFGALVETVTGQPIGMANRYSAATAEAGASTLIPEHGEATVRPDQETEMKARDRENAMVLINELLKNSGDGISNVRRSILQDLLRGHQSQLCIEELMLGAHSLE